MSKKWVWPQGGKHGVAINSKIYELNPEKIDNHFGRPLDKWTHYLSYERQSYVIFTFALEHEAGEFMKAYGGEPMNPSDRGRGQNWMKWYKGRTARKEARRSPYDFK